MSDKLMDTEAGGETPQYESIHTVTVPSTKEGGTMGKAETGVADSVKDLNQSDDRGERTADNIRYGQNISESGQGGMTAGNTGTANSDVGYGGADQDASTDDAVKTRQESGYGGKQDMDREIGA